MVHALQPDQERVKSLLSDTIKLLCKNGLSYKTEFCLNGVIGITLDRSDVFLVDIRETVKLDGSDEEESSSEVAEYGEINQTVSKKRKRRRKDRSPKPVDSPIALDVIEIPDNQFKEELAAIKTEQIDHDNRFGFEPYQDFKSNLLNVPTSFPVSSSGNMSSSQSHQPHPLPMPAPFMQHSLGNQHQSLPQQHSQDKLKCVYTCSICQQTMSTSNGLRYHMNRHKGIFPYYCPYCNKGQPGTTDLKNHLASVHTNGQAGYVCIYCQYTAPSCVALKAHLDICPSSQGTLPTDDNQAPRACDGNDSEETQPTGG